MSLINCPYCGKKVSSKAETCPHCGNALKSSAKDFYCNECGSVIKAGNKFCPNCGCPVSENGNSSTIKKFYPDNNTSVSNVKIKPKKKKRRVIGIACLAAVALALSFLYVSRHTSDTGTKETEAMAADNQLTETKDKKQNSKQKSSSGKTSKKTSATPKVTQTADTALSKEREAEIADKLDNIRGENEELTAILQDIRRTYLEFQYKEDDAYSEFLETMTNSYAENDTNTEAVEDYFDNLNNDTSSMLETVKSDVAKYYETISSTIDNSEANSRLDAMDKLYSVAYTGLYNELYDDIYNGLYEDAYDDIYDGLIKKAYDTLPYEKWDSARSTFYDIWSVQKSDLFAIYSDANDNFYNEWNDKEEALISSYMS